MQKIQRYIYIDRYRYTLNIKIESEKKKNI